MEVGLGGRLDATNVLPAPRAAAITRIAFDHMDRLGSTLVEIAREKAGIAKPGLDIVVGPVEPEVRAAIDEVARAHGATTSDARHIAPPALIGLAGAHQRDNARIAAVLGARIGASPAAVERGIAEVQWPGRLERIGTFLLDAAHNPDGAAALAAHLAQLARPARDVALVFGTLGDKDWPPMLDALAPFAERRIYLAPHGIAAAARTAVDPAAMAARHPGVTVDSMTEALAVARASPFVVVAGSLVLLGDARALLLGLPRDPPVAL
jgi:dihydrofolate synthase/folylpolyglutamate synthase